MPDIFYISTIKAIKTLSSDRRLKMLRYLVDKEYSTQELAEIFNIKPNVLWYDVKQLEENGLIELIRSEQVRGTVKKYYRAVAKNFFVDVSLGAANLNDSKIIQNFINQEIEDWRREKIIKISFKKIAHKIIKQNLGIKENEVVAISYQPMHQKLVEDLMVEIAKNGAYAIPIFWSKRIESNYIKNVPIKFATKDVISDFLIDKIDVHIIFSGEFLDEDDEEQLSPELIEKSNQIEEIKRKNIRKTFQTKVRYLTIDTLQNSPLSDVSPEIRSEMYWKSLYINSESLKKECKFVQKKLQSARYIEIKDDNGGKLKITLPKQRTIKIKDGIANLQSTDSELPGGMVVTLLVPSPIIPADAGTRIIGDGSIDGEFHTDFAYLFDKKFEDVFIKIEKGKLKTIKSNNNEIQKMFDNAEGDKDVVGSFCIGLNPALYQNIGHPFINSKIYGAISLQVGWDELESSKVDSDMIAQFFMLNKTIKVDGSILFEKGKLYQ
ncbi:MAG: winged helix-turn-helix transcriptional regulator [Candidatus Cloacimonetes bacterium]|nr:winged helix-turn-helix transcriptional regulator [Candidatus Cloacimonadota bacterium]